MDMDELFMTFLRTKLVFQNRLKDLKDYNTVKVYLYELEKLGVKGSVLFNLRRSGKIWYDDYGNFRCMEKGAIDPSLIEKTRKWKRVEVPLNPLHEYMKEQLRFVTIDRSLTELPAYFKAFALHRNQNLDAFFSVDGFSGRVHTPIVNLKGELRKSLRLKGSKLVSLDVKQMQPTILSLILSKAVGRNPFSNAIDEGKDIYLVLLDQNVNLRTREEAKKFLYQLIFGKPMDDIGMLFRGDTRWVDWVNRYKIDFEPRNPHGREPHTNLAWLLQSEEVRLMTMIWKRLMGANVSFLTIHDDILVARKDKDFTYSVIEEELGKHFKKFEIIVS
jgi:hypothetical protein